MLVEILTLLRGFRPERPDSPGSLAPCLVRAPFYVGGVGLASRLCWRARVKAWVLPGDSELVDSLLLLCLIMEAWVGGTSLVPFVMCASPTAPQPTTIVIVSRKKSALFLGEPKLFSTHFGVLRQRTIIRAITFTGAESLRVLMTGRTTCPLATVLTSARVRFGLMFAT